MNTFTFSFFPSEISRIFFIINAGILRTDLSYIVVALRQKNSLICLASINLRLIHFFFFPSLSMFIFFAEVVDPLSQSRYFFPFSVRKQPSPRSRKKLLLSGFHFCCFSSLFFLSLLSLNHIKLLCVLSYCAY